MIAVNFINNEIHGVFHDTRPSTSYLRAYAVQSGARQQVSRLHSTLISDGFKWSM